MPNWLSKVPWFVGAPAVVIATVVGAAAANYFTGPLFHETCHNERNLLTGEFEASNCGEGAKVASRATTTPEKTSSPGIETPASTPATAPTRGATTGVLAMGAFRDGEPGHQGSGRAELQLLADGRLNLFLANFSVTNGPDLVVVLSADPGGSRGSVSEGVTLEKLKANNGNQNYAIPAGADLSRFKSVIIYCKSFPTVFAYAKLESTQ